MARQSVLFISAMMFVGACAVPVFHATGIRQFPAKNPDCVIRTVGTHPGPGYEEIGLISIEGDRGGGAGSFQNPMEFTERVRPQICAAGGDTVVTEVNGFGVVSRGIVFRHVEDTPVQSK